jgi:hypothetical protein
MLLQVDSSKSASPRPIAKDQAPGDRRRPDLLAPFWAAEVLPMLGAAPWTRSVVIFNEICRRHPEVGQRMRRTLERRIRNWRATNASDGDRQDHNQTSHHATVPLESWRGQNPQRAVVLRAALAEGSGEAYQQGTTTARISESGSKARKAGWRQRSRNMM